MAPHCISEPWLQSLKTVRTWCDECLVPNHIGPIRPVINQFPDTGMSLSPTDSISWARRLCL
eukprot:8412125-Lingulodinium_polyedra.AAC.1